jgi:hypothetical protein
MHTMMRYQNSDPGKASATRKDIDYNRLTTLIRGMEEVAYGLVQSDEGSAARSLFFAVTELEAVCAKRHVTQTVKELYPTESSEEMRSRQP